MTEVGYRACDCGYFICPFIPEYTRTYDVKTCGDVYCTRKDGVIFETYRDD